MKVVILAGGLGTRISEETSLKPKPMVEIGGKPLLWHIMKHYATFDIHEFIICCGYRGYVIKEYFSNYFLHMSDVTFDMKSNQMMVHSKNAEPWKVTLIDTGDNTNTAGRLKRVSKFIKDDELFCFTYGDGLSNINIKKSIIFHQAHNKLVTISAVKPPGRYGAIEKKGVEVTSFIEKPSGDGGFINGGFFVLSPKVISYIKNDSSAWEGDVLRKLAKDGEVRAFEHKGFWHAMDTLRDKNHLDILWENNSAPWKVW